MKIMFTGRDGTTTQAQGHPGQRLLDVAQAAGQPLEGTCNGGMACATCHVIVDPADIERLPRAGADEEDMLDLAPGATRTSRLACQIRLDAGHDGLRVTIPRG